MAFTMLNRDRMSVTVRPTDEKSLSDCAELARMHRSLRHNRIFRRVVLPELQRVAESEWRLKRIRPIVRQVHAV